MVARGMFTLSFRLDPQTLALRFLFLAEHLLDSCERPRLSGSPAIVRGLSFEGYFRGHDLIRYEYVNGDKHESK